MPSLPEAGATTRAHSDDLTCDYTSDRSYPTSITHRQEATTTSTSYSHMAFQQNTKTASTEEDDEALFCLTISKPKVLLHLPYGTFQTSVLHLQVIVFVFEYLTFFASLAVILLDLGLLMSSDYQPTHTLTHSILMVPSVLLYIGVGACLGCVSSRMVSHPVQVVQVQYLCFWCTLLLCVAAVAVDVLHIYAKLVGSVVIKSLLPQLRTTPGFLLFGAVMSYFGAMVLNTQPTCPQVTQKVAMYP